MSASAKPPPRMTVQDFLCWTPDDGRHYELVDGEPHAMAPASNVHGLLQGELARLIGNHLRAQKAGCNVIVAPGVVPNLLSAHNVRIPDLGVTCVPVAPGQSVLSDPILLIEILSPSNALKTWSNVRAYKSIPSVKEILVLQSTRIGAEVLRRMPEGAWPEEPLPLLGDDLALTSIGFHVAFSELYEQTGLAM
jgi:Uma2 family endonuclease